MRHAQTAPSSLLSFPRIIKDPPPPTPQVRRALLAAYDAFLDEAFGAARLREAGRKPADERFAVATPGGEPWRRSLVLRPQQPPQPAGSGE